jgi:hypothetical protein
MPTFTTTAKHALRRLSGSNAILDVDAGFEALADDIDAKLTPYDAGLLAARPTSTSGSPGKAGRTYRVTSGSQAGVVFLDTGTSWVPLGSELLDLHVSGIIKCNQYYRGNGDVGMFFDTGSGLILLYGDGGLSVRNSDGSALAPVAASAFKAASYNRASGAAGLYLDDTTGTETLLGNGGLFVRNAANSAWALLRAGDITSETGNYRRAGGTLGLYFDGPTSSETLYGTGGLFVRSNDGAAAAPVSASAFTVVSDERLKHFTVPGDQADILAQLRTLDVIAYTLRNPAEDQRPRRGLRAQQLQTIRPELVTSRPAADDEVEHGDSLADGDEVLAVDYQALIPDLIAAIQAQAAQIDKLTDRIAALEATS